MAKCIPILMILNGLGMFFMFGFMSVAYDTIFKIAVPISLGILPLNQVFQLWVAVPLALEVKASLISGFASKQVSGKTLAVIHLNFALEMDQQDSDPDVAFPIMWIEAEDITEFQRYVIQLSEGKVNYGQYAAWAFAGMTSGMAAFGGLLYFMFS